MASQPIVAGWTASNTDNGFVGPGSFGTSDIICHKNSANAKGHAVVAAGDKIFVQWDTWPESHKGPVIDYLGNCGSADCETVDKTALEHPSPISPSFYVLRYEIIVLHSAGQANGAQNYPRCFNLQVTGSGSAAHLGVKGTSLYTATDPGILVNIYTSLKSYAIPGPALISGAVGIAQAKPAIATSATAFTGAAAVLAGTPTTAATSATAQTTKPSATTLVTTITAATPSVALPIATASTAIATVVAGASCNALAPVLAPVPTKATSFLVCRSACNGSLSLLPLLFSSNS
ncbi:glycosyl hydrolase family 61-domain-containing protein [Lasiosphaeris hirsuta]|uniref:lytic cellulose monooxygenase (C4-dehydrogenating) n=1 Tax=Lasiosphaeris hirsuta TaxID=260670 RepID=A0AA40DLM7_9PEZI|nr:glycosyl hydrolase family 61-domain-containing protein [Lasiosphaeris hirsuta]